MVHVMSRTQRWVAIALFIYAVSSVAGTVVGAQESSPDGPPPGGSPIPILVGRSGDVTVERRGRMQRFSVQDGQRVETWDVFRTGEGGRVSFAAEEAGLVLGGRAIAAFDGRILRLVRGRMDVATGAGMSIIPMAEGDAEARGVASRQLAIIAGEVHLQIASGTVGAVERSGNGSVVASVFSGRIDLSDTRGRSVIVEPGTVGVLNAPVERLSVREIDGSPAAAVSREIVRASSRPGVFERMLFSQTRIAFRERFSQLRGARNTTDDLKRADGRVPIPANPVENPVADSAFEGAVLSLELERMTERLRGEPGVLSPGTPALLNRRGRALRYTSRLVQ